MTNSNSSHNYSNDHLPYEILVRIFMLLNIEDLAIGSLVCESWKKASRDPTLWRKLDLTKLDFGSTKITQFLKYALDLSNGNINCLIFNFYLHLQDVHLIIAAKRTPNLKRLVLPLRGELSKTGIDVAMGLWRGLESITINPLVSSNIGDLLSAIGKYCINITEIKFTFRFGRNEAEALVKYTPNLKVLSIRGMNIFMSDLCHVLKELEHLQIVNICHSHILRHDSIVIYPIGDLGDHLNDTSLGKLIIRRKRMCHTCNYGLNPIGQSLGELEDVWIQDEIESLAH